MRVAAVAERGLPALIHPQAAQVVVEAEAALRTTEQMVSVVVAEVHRMETQMFTTGVMAARVL